MQSTDDIVNMLRNPEWIDNINLYSVLCTLYSRLFLPFIARLICYTKNIQA